MSALEKYLREIDAELPQDYSKLFRQKMSNETRKVNIDTLPSHTSFYVYFFILIIKPIILFVMRVR